MFLPFLDPTMVLLIPALFFAFWAQSKVKSTYRKYSRIRSASGLTGSDVARRILNLNGLQDVKVEPVPGELSDHYDPRTHTVRLSEGIYGRGSIAALGIAAFIPDFLHRIYLLKYGFSDGSGYLSVHRGIGVSVDNPAG